MAMIRSSPDAWLLLLWLMWHGGQGEPLFRIYTILAALNYAGPCGINQEIEVTREEKHMASTWLSQRLPRFESAIRQLTEQHRQLKDEPLHLAVSYAPQREQEDIFLLEVIGGNGDRLAENHELFETIFTSTSGFPMHERQRLHLLLATPGEWETALREGWPAAEEIRVAIAEGDYKVLHADEIGQRLLSSLPSPIRRQEEIARG